MKKLHYILILAGALTLMLAHKANGQTLKVMEWNILSFEGVGTGQPNDFNVVPFVEYIREHNPDIVCFNELEDLTSRVYNEEKLAVMGSMLGMYYYFGYSYDKSDGYYGNGILSKYPFINAASYELSMFEGADPRSVEYVDILVPTDANPDGVVIRIACTHLDHQTTATGNNSNKRQQLNQAFNYAEGDGSLPMLFIGDLNISTGQQDQMSTVLAKADKLCDNTGTFVSGSKLDYLLGYPQKAWTVNSYEVIKTSYLATLSDHYPYVAVVTLN